MRWIGFGDVGCRDEDDEADSDPAKLGVSLVRSRSRGWIEARRGETRLDPGQVHAGRNNRRQGEKQRPGIDLIHPRH
jgi:hypothetical protein